jgi:pimeloyl-ACP methyl ester carboxylesterase
VSEPAHVEPRPNGDAARVLLVHGAWHGAWCWERVVQALAARGIEAHAVELPGHGSSALPLGGLADDARAVRAALDALPAPVVVCGHSYGGCVITEAAAGHPAVAHLVYLAAFMPDADETLTDLIQSASSSVSGEEAAGDLAPALLPALVPHPDGTVTVDAAGAVEAFYGSCAPDVAAWAAARLVPEAGASFVARPAGVAWRTLPSTYVICTRDRALPPALQRRLARRAGESLEWESDHSPFLHASARLASLLERCARSAARRA